MVFDECLPLEAFGELLPVGFEPIAVAVVFVPLEDRCVELDEFQFAALDLGECFGAVGDGQLGHVGRAVHDGKGGFYWHGLLLWNKGLVAKRCIQWWLWRRWVGVIAFDAVIWLGDGLWLGCKRGEGIGTVQVLRRIGLAFFLGFDHLGRSLGELGRGGELTFVVGAAARKCAEPDFLADKDNVFAADSGLYFYRAQSEQLANESAFGVPWSFRHTAPLSSYTRLCHGSRSRALCRRGGRRPIRRAAS